MLHSIKPRVLKHKLRWILGLPAQLPIVTNLLISLPPTMSSPESPMAYVTHAPLEKIQKSAHVKSLDEYQSLYDMSIKDPEVSHRPSLPPRQHSAAGLLMLPLASPHLSLSFMLWPNLQVYH